MAHPRIEEVSDSEDGFSDPSEDDIDDFAETDILRQVQPKSAAPSASQHQQRQTPASRLPPQQQPQIHRQQQQPPPDFGRFAALYPIYFDKSRSRAQGRRVGSELAVENPLARDIVAACATLGLRTVFEPTKTHPKDWANPGRVRVDLASAKANSSAKTIANKHHLYILVSRYLKAHPTTEHSAGLRETVQGAPPPPPMNEPYPRPAVPRGWKLPTLVPYLSPAMTGGGVSENLFQDVMKEMQGGGPGGAGGAGMQQAMQAALSGMGGAGGGAGALTGGDGGGGSKKSKKGKGKA